MITRFLIRTIYRQKSYLGNNLKIDIPDFLEINLSPDLNYTLIGKSPQN